MDVEINILGVFLAAMASMIVGSIWYSKPVFGAAWAKLANISDKQQKEMGWSAMIYMFLLSLIMAYVLAHVAYLSFSFFVDQSYLSSAMTSGFWMWLGFIVTTTVGTGLFSHTRKKILAINVGNWLVTLLVMGWVIGTVGL